MTSPVVDQPPGPAGTPAAGPILSVRDLVKSFPVRRGGGPVRSRQVVHAVSGVSFDLFAGEVLSLDRLIEIVWGKDVFLTDRVVYTHVNNLRGKIEENPSQPRHIVSLRGLGYRFDV